MPSRNIMAPVSDWSPEAIARTREPETGEGAGSVSNTPGENLAGKHQTTCGPRQLWDILARHSDGRLSRRLWRCLFIELDPVPRCWSQNAKRKY
jgi:hypothetical protein